MRKTSSLLVACLALVHLPSISADECASGQRRLNAGEPCIPETMFNYLYCLEKSGGGKIEVVKKDDVSGSKNFEIGLQGKGSGIIIKGEGAGTFKQAEANRAIKELSEKIDPSLATKCEHIVATLPVAKARTDDFVRIVAISPRPSATLSTNYPFAITLRLQYQLASADKAIIVPYLEQFGTGGCTGGHHTIAQNEPSQIPIRRGQGEVSVVFYVDADHKNQLKGSGFVAPGASLWAGFDSGGRVIAMDENLIDYTDVCYHFASS